MPRAALGGCLKLLDEARGEDPWGDVDERITAQRRSAAEGLGACGTGSDAGAQPAPGLGPTPR